MRLPLTERETARVRGTWRDCTASRRGARQLRQLRHCALAMRLIGRDPMAIGRWIMSTKPGNVELVLVVLGLTACAMIATGQRWAAIVGLAILLPAECIAILAVCAPRR